MTLGSPITQNNNELTYIFKCNEISLSRNYVGNTLVVPYLYIKTHFNLYDYLFPGGLL